MIAVVVAAHGHLAEELLRTAEQVAGPLEKVLALSAAPHEVHDKLCAALGSLDDGDGVLVLCDLLGGSLTQCALPLCASRKVEVVAGVNLPMLLKLTSLRRKGLGLVELAREVAAVGRAQVVLASELVRKQAG